MKARALVVSLTKQKVTVKPIVAENATCEQVMDVGITAAHAARVLLRESCCGLGPLVGLCKGEKMSSQFSMSREDRDQAYQDCLQAAIDAGALEPQDWKERMAAGVLTANGQCWADTPVARARLEAFVQECLRQKGF
jgi:hypothetical protein